MKIFLSALFLFVSISVFSQDSLVEKTFKPIHRGNVEKEINDSTKKSYYPLLVARLKAFDAKLSLRDYRLLYYGYVFQKSYNPFFRIDDKAIHICFEKSDFAGVVRICDSALAENMLFLSAWNNKAIALSRMNDKRAFDQTMRIYLSLLNAIVSTGDGLACETGFRVIHVSDEYEVLRSKFNIKEIKSQGVNFPCDQISILPTQYFPAPVMFFNVSESLNGMKKIIQKK